LKAPSFSRRRSFGVCFFAEFFEEVFVSLLVVCRGAELFPDFSETDIQHFAGKDAESVIPQNFCMSGLISSSLRIILMPSVFGAFMPFCSTKNRRYIDTGLKSF
jgi:hypothetical protein